jgi:hypothetical protein
MVRSDTVWPRILALTEFDHSPGGCWRWTGSHNNRGYGMVGVPTGRPERRHTMKTVHRLVQVLLHGELGKLNALHQRWCPHRDCWRPSHIYLGTLSQNVADAMALGRHVSPPVFMRDTHPTAKLTTAQVEALIADLTRGMRQTVVALKYGISQPQVSKLWIEHGPGRREKSHRAAYHPDLAS